MILKKTKITALIIISLAVCLVLVFLYTREITSYFELELAGDLSDWQMATLYDGFDDNHDCHKSGNKD